MHRCGRGAAARPRASSRREVGAGAAAAAVVVQASASQAQPMPRLDAHLHVWATPAEARDGFPYKEGQPDPPPADGSVAATLEAFREAGVAGGLVVQPINHGFDHAYVRKALAEHPGRFVGCCLADPSDPAALEALLADPVWRAVRFNPYLWPEGATMADEAGRRMFALAGSRGAAVGFMCFHGLLPQLDAIMALMDESPDTKVLMDHFGFCKEEGGEDFAALLALARYPQVYVKLSAFFRVSAEGKYPYADTAGRVRKLLDAYGAERLVWGSDWPFIANECGYTEGAAVLDGVEMSDRERELVMGGALQALFPGGWSA